MNDSLYTTQDIIKWITKLNNDIEVSIKRINLSQSKFWFYDKNKGAITNKSNSFFSITGISKKVNNDLVEQPIIIQDEIGYLGIITKEFDGVMHYLMQGKIEPGNVNNVQISPTIQATKSNFEQKHGGRPPKYIEYFKECKKYEIIVDQLQSEQSSRFYKKRNRNIIIKLKNTDEIELNDNYKWLTLSQLKELMKLNNIVNMDTRTVLSCIPNTDVVLNTNISNIYNYINDYKMFNNNKEKLIELHNLKNWCVTDYEITCNHEHDFKIIFCDISINGREVTNWTQPLFQACGKATLGLIITYIDNQLYILVQAKPEIGSYDMLELAPSVQLESVYSEDELTVIDRIFFERWKNNINVINNVILSEEGGRFYQEENYNVIIKLDKYELNNLPNGYFLISHTELLNLNRINNCLNIQLRNLLSLL